MVQAASESAGQRDALASWSYDFAGTWTLHDDGGVAGGLGWLVEGGRALFSDRDSDLSGDTGAAQGLNDDLDSTDAALSEFWWSQGFADASWVITVGRLDPTVFFDGNAVANDETAQFLSTPLVNSVAVAFPENGVGANVSWFAESGTHYVSAGVGDANADGGESVFNDFGGGDFFTGLELGWTPTLGEGRQGSYRVLGWTTRTRDGSDGSGVSLSVDQEVGGGITLFGRYAAGDDEVLDFDRAASGGVGVSGWYGRDEDLLGVGLAWARASGGGGEETLVEVFYRLTLSPQMSVTPHVQWVDPPSGSTPGDTLAVVGVRLQATY